MSNVDNLNWQAAELRKWQRHKVGGSFRSQNIRYYRRMLRYYEKQILKEARRYTASFKVGDLILHNDKHYSIRELRGGFAYCWVTVPKGTFLVTTKSVPPLNTSERIADTGTCRDEWVRLDDFESAQ